MFHKRKERKDCRGSFWRRSLSFLLVLLLMAGCVQVVGNQAEAASEPLSEFQPETQAGTEVLLSETELIRNRFRSLKVSPTQRIFRKRKQKRSGRRKRISNWKPNGKQRQPLI